MDRNRLVTATVVLCCCFFFIVIFFFLSTPGNEEQQLTNNYWTKVKTLINQAQPYFFPPNLDFRRRRNDQTEGGSGEKVKEAVVKSFGKSKAAVEDSAKSAADLVGDTANKVKESLSHPRQEL